MEQLDAAKALLQHAYSCPLPTSASLLIQICTLADRERMVAAEQAACLAMEGQELMPEEVLCFAYTDPLPGLLGTDSLRQLQQKAAEALQQRYGDLEKVLNSEELLRTFKQLPFGAVLALLQHEATSAGAEGAVCLAVSRWLGAKPDGQVSKGQLRQLAAEVRFAGLSRSYRHYELPSITWLVEGGLKPQELAWVLTYFQL